MKRHIMSLSPDIKQRIEIYINATIDTLLNKYDRNIITNYVLEESLLNPKNGNYKPFHQALIPIELFRFQAFFRSFSTSLGSGIFEYMAKEIAKNNKTKWLVVKKAKFDIRTDAKTTEMIGKYLDELEKSKGNKSKDYSLPDYLFANSNEYVSYISKTVDLYLKDINQREYFLEIKSPKPNKGQSKDTKRDLLKLKVTYPNAKIILALTFNPYGEDRDNFKNSYLPYYFDISDPKSVMIGKDFWDFLGGKGTYNDLIELFTVIGNSRKDEIKHKLLGDDNE